MGAAFVVVSCPAIDCDVSFGKPAYLIRAQLCPLIHVPRPGTAQAWNG